MYYFNNYIVSAEFILDNANLAVVDGCMRCIVDRESGNVYNLPNFVINDPFYKKDVKKEEIFEEKRIKVTRNLKYRLN